jgi:hypothetical protein
VTVPVDDAPPFTVAGDNVTLTSGGVELAGGFTVSPTFAALAPYAAVSDTAVEVVTDLLVTNANEAVVDPVKTVTFGGNAVKSSRWFVDTLTRTGTDAGAASDTVAMPPSPPPSVVTFAPKRRDSHAGHGADAQDAAERRRIEVRRERHVTRRRRTAREDAERVARRSGQHVVVARKQGGDVGIAARDSDDGIRQRRPRCRGESVR